MKLRGMAENPTMSFAFLGDIILNRGYIELWKEEKRPFKALEGYLSEFDFVIANLECIAFGSEGVNPLRSTVIGTEPETLGFLQQLNIDVVTLAHNHVYDHKESGFKNTVNKLDDLGIQYLGASLDSKKQYEPLILDKNGIKVGLLNYVTEDTNPNIPEDAQVYLNWFNLEKVKSDIYDLKQKVDHVVVLPHWGGKTEYSLLPHVEQVKMAEEIVSVGADLIVGHHSHTIQPHQIIDGKDIFYSIGNFCIDMKLYNYRKRRMAESLLVVVEFERYGYTSNVFGLKNNDGLVDFDESVMIKKSNLYFKNWYLRMHNYFHIKFERWVNKLSHNLFRIFKK